MPRHPRSISLLLSACVLALGGRVVQPAVDGFGEAHRRRDTRLLVRSRASHWATLTGGSDTVGDLRAQLRALSPQLWGGRARGAGEAALGSHGGKYAKVFDGHGCIR